MRVLLTRPLEDAEAFAARLCEAGHGVLIAPLLSVHFPDGPPLALDGVEGLVATSANGVRALARRTRRRDIPLYAVGPQTADASRQAGFTQVESADGDVAALAQAMPRWAGPGGMLLHATSAEGEGRLASLLAAKGYVVQSVILYDVVASTQLPDNVVQALTDCSLDAAFFFSPRSARVFTECIAKAGLAGACANLTALCISEATASELTPLGFKACRIAQKPNQDALLACLS